MERPVFFHHRAAEYRRQAEGIQEAELKQQLEEAADRCEAIADVVDRILHSPAERAI